MTLYWAVGQRGREPMAAAQELEHWAARGALLDWVKEAVPLGTSADGSWGPGDRMSQPPDPPKCE